MNWKKLIFDIRALGMTQQQIAAHVGCRQSSISDLHVGKVKNPKFKVGLALIELAKQKGIDVCTD